MITKNDCLMLLSDLKANGIEVNSQMKLLLKQNPKSKKSAT